MLVQVEGIAVRNVPVAAVAKAGAPTILDDPVPAGRTRGIIAIPDQGNRVVVAVIDHDFIIRLQIGHGAVHVVGVEAHLDRAGALDHALQICGGNPLIIGFLPDAVLPTTRQRPRIASPGREGIIRVQRAFRLGNDAMRQRVSEYCVKAQFAGRGGRNRIPQHLLIRNVGNEGGVVPREHVPHLEFGAGSKIPTCPPPL